MTPMQILTLMKTTLAAVPATATCKIGLEANITADDYPLIRIVPTRLQPATEGYQRGMEVLIYFGAPLLEAKDGLEAVYEELMGMERAILEAMQFTIVMALRTTAGEFVRIQYLDTITDEDRLPLYKLFAARFIVEV
jgi:hypothetical protein